MDDLGTNDRAIDSPYVSDETPDVRYVYWARVRPEPCHYRLSPMEYTGSNDRPPAARIPGVASGTGEGACFVCEWSPMENR